jgi:hypothetical protein
MDVGGVIMPLLETDELQGLVVVGFWAGELDSRW